LQRSFAAAVVVLVINELSLNELRFSLSSQCIEHNSKARQWSVDLNVW